MAHALITGGSRGLGRALSHTLLDAGWHVTATGRTKETLTALHDEARANGTAHRLTSIAGDITDPNHHRIISTAGPYTAVVCNASALGVSHGGPTLRPLLDTSAEDLASVLSTNVVAYHQLLSTLLTDQVVAPETVLAITSDAAIKHYETWGAYGASKAALDHLIGTFAAECPTTSWYSVDPGEMRTEMLAEAMPGESLGFASDPADVAATLHQLLTNTTNHPSGRYQAADLTGALV